MIHYIDELEKVLEMYNIDKNDIMIVGSSTITDFGLRPNNDIEFSCNRKAYRKIPFKIKIWLLITDHYDVSKNVDIFHQRYINIGIHDSSLFKRKLYTMRYGYKVVKPEIEYCYKKRRNWEKDVLDIKKIESSSVKNKINWNYTGELQNRKVSKIDTGYERLRIALSWRLAAFKEWRKRRKRI